MSIHKLLVANRGEIAIRILRAADELGIGTVAVHAADDARCLHTRHADIVVGLDAEGPAAYLDVAGIVAAAREYGCDAIHPGYGFLSERAELAVACGEAGIVFVGPRAETLRVFGDKIAARARAVQAGLPVLPGFDEPVDLAALEGFFDAHADRGVMLKARAGGGGRGMRVVRARDELAPALERCGSEAEAAFGDGAVFVESLAEHARHVEVQVAGDRSGDVLVLGERECSLQRRHQKIVEIAPAPGLGLDRRNALHDAARRLAREAGLENLATVEFLVETEPGGLGVDAGFAFLEVNPRLQVEHTVTEETAGIDLVKAQLHLAAGGTLADAGLDGAELPDGFAIQVRVNMERMGDDGSVLPTGGTLHAFEPPSGPGVRVDTLGYQGYTTSPRYDSLLAKVIAHAPGGSYADALRRGARALSEFRIEGVETNLPFLRRLLAHEDVAAGRFSTAWIDETQAALVEAPEPAPRHFAAGTSSPAAPGLAGARVDSQDPLAVLDHGKSGAAAAPVAAPPTPEPAPTDGPPGTRPVRAPLQGTIVEVLVDEGALAAAGAPLLVMEAMKMEHVVEAPFGGVVRAVAVCAGDAVFQDHALVFLEESEDAGAVAAAEDAVDLDHVRPDLAEVHARHAIGLDPARPAAVARRRKTGQRTARENVADLCDAGSFVEYGPIVIAGQRRRRSIEDLVENTPADGMIAGLGSVNGDRFPDDRSRCAVLSYDYTVLAGTQGMQNHRKKDRLFEIAEQWRLPLVFFTEGGGGRPGDTDGIGVAGLDCMAFHYFGRLSGLVPLVGINSGRCFAGNAALLGCCDVVIATAGSNIGMGGPAMIEGGGLGVFRPDEVGPMDVQVPNGVVDVPVEDEAEAVQVARQYLSYFQGPVDDWSCVDQRRLRSAIPENRLRIYDVRAVIEQLADTDSVLELRRAFGAGMVTALARVEGRPIGIVANNPTHLAGAIDSDGADKAARFMQLCDAFDLPILFLCDTPGIMVGPEVERTALVRHAARMFVTGGSVSVPFFTIVLRKGYGLGAQAMAGGSFKANVFTVAWPTGEFGGMGLEGAVKLGYRKELAALEDPEERRALYEEMVERMYQHGKAVNTASTFEIDDVIDPADSRTWILRALRSVPAGPPRTSKKRPFVDTW